MTTETTTTEQTEAIERIREAVSQTGTIYGTVRHVSRSGMRRIIHFWTIKDNQPVHIDHDIVTATGWYKLSKSTGPWGIVVDGCGMDMIFSVVYDVARILNPDDPYAIKHSQI